MIRDAVQIVNLTKICYSPLDKQGELITMCLTALMFDPNPPSNGYRLVLAFNRDEFYERPTKPAEFWERNPNIISGQDLFVGKEGGTWLGMSRSGRLAMLLNVLQPDGINLDAKGRGSLVSDFLNGSMDGLSYLNSVAQEHAQYNGFNLITMEFGEKEGVDVYYYTNFAPERKDPVKIKPGIHAFSNHTRNTSWEKTDCVRSEMEKLMLRISSMTKESLSEELMRMMSCAVPLISSVDQAKEAVDFGKLQSLLREIVFVKSSVYGTRTTTIILVDASSNVTFTEKSMKEPIVAHSPIWDNRTHTFSML